jgi:acetyl esterase/lipase
MLFVFTFFVGPVVAYAEPPPLEAYGELPEVEDAALSPSGERLAVIGKINGNRTLLFMDRSMAVLRSATLGDVKSRGLQWAGEDAILLVTSETVDLGHGFTTDQFEATRVMYIPLDPEEQIYFVFSGSDAVVNSVFGLHGIRQIDGDWYGYYGGIGLKRDNNMRQSMPHTRPALYQVRLRDNRLKRQSVPAAEGDWRDWIVDADGEVAVIFDMNRNTGRWSIEGPNGKTLVRGEDKEGDASLVALGKDGTTVIYSVEGDNERTDWIEISLDGMGEPVVMFEDEDVTRIYIDPTNNRLIGYMLGGEVEEPVFFDPDRQSAATKVARAFSKLEYSMIDRTPDMKHMIVRTSGNGDSGTWFLVDVENLAAQGFGIERPLIAPEQVGAISVFPYVASDGLEMDGILTLPPDKPAENLPVVIFPHGGPTGQDDPEFNWWAQAFASRGYAIFQPNFRGSTNRDEDFYKAGRGEWGRKMQSDLSDGLSALAEEGIVDPSRACIMGASYGGYAALAGVTLQNGIYRCSVAVAPVSDLRLMYTSEYSESGKSRVVRQSLLEQLGPVSTLGDISPRRFADRADAPILLIHGRDDTVVPFEQSEKMADGLKDADKPYELIDLGGEDHWLSGSQTRKQMLEAAVKFIERHNPAD